MADFTPERRERFLTLLAAGASVEEACAGARVGRSTVSRWAAAGRAPDADVAVRDFAARLAEVREGVELREPLSEGDIDRSLERGVRNGSTAAARELRLRQERREKPEPEPVVERPGAWAWRQVLKGDYYVATEPERMAELTPEQQARAVEVAEAHHAALRRRRAKA